MLLIKTYSKKPLDSYSDYLMLLHQEEWTTVQEEVQAKNLKDFDWYFTTNLNQKKLEFENGTYRFQCDYDTRRHVYVVIEDHKIKTILFDYIQFHELTELMELENMKQNVLQEKATAYYDLKNQEISCEELNKFVNEFDNLRLIKWNTYPFLNGVFQ